MAEKASPLKLYKPGQIAPSRGICLYGKGGTGKTTLLGTMPGKGLVIDVPQIEGGTEVIANHADRIDVTPVESWNEVEAVYKFLASGEHEFRWVAFDSITAFTELAKRRTIRERELSADPYKIELQDWGKIGQLVGDLIYKFRTLKLITIWVAQEDKRDGVTCPALTPAALTALMPSMALVARLSVAYNLTGQVERILQVGSSPECLTKCRAKPEVTVPQAIRSPNLETLLRYLAGQNVELDIVDSGGFAL